eukprot:350539-Chlamydomonas_euryale.AAC.4
MSVSGASGNGMLTSFYTLPFTPSLPDRAPGAAAGAGAGPSAARSSRLFDTTATELTAIMPAATLGLRHTPADGSSAPAASGMPTTLYASAHARFWRILDNVARPSTMLSTTWAHARCARQRREFAAPQGRFGSVGGMAWWRWVGVECESMALEECRLMTLEE